MQEAGARKPTRAYVSAEYCKKCHREQEASKVDLSRLTEYHYWENADRHRIAWTVLKGPRARAIGLRLNGKNGPDAADDQRCIACHATDTSRLGSAPDNELVEKYKYTSPEGVSCVECHGPALEWVVYHGLPTREWRNFSRKQKENDFGMTDLWNPYTRAKLCLSCHLGDRKQGRFVTHEMYAAGHPPLPGIELAAFSDELPRHWEYLGEKYKNINLGAKDKEIKEMLGIRPDRLERTEVIAIFGLVALRESLDQFAVEADERENGSMVLDYARYDCYACHHDLQASDRSWRQARATAGASGRPDAVSWPRTLAILSIVAAQPEAAVARRREQQLSDRLRDFHAAVRAQPFGDRKRVLKAVESFKTWADPIIGELVELTKPPERSFARPSRPRRIIDKTTASAMLERLCALAGEGVPDYDSARQIAWAFRTIYDELTSTAPPDHRIVAELNQLDSQLVLRLHPRTSRRDLIPTNKEQEPIAEGELFLRRLRAVAEYDPAEFQRHFREIARHLPKP